MNVRMGASDNFVLSHPLVREWSEQAEGLERLRVVEDVVDHSPEVVGVVREWHDLRGVGRGQLKQK